MWWVIGPAPSFSTNPQNLGNVLKYGIKNKAAIALQGKSNVKLIVALIYIVCTVILYLRRRMVDIARVNEFLLQICENISLFHNE